MEYQLFVSLSVTAEDVRQYHSTRMFSGSEASDDCGRSPWLGDGCGRSTWLGPGHGSSGSDALDGCGRSTWLGPGHGSCLVGPCGIIIRGCGSMSPSLMLGARGVSGQLENN